MVSVGFYAEFSEQLDFYFSLSSLIFFVAQDIPFGVFPLIYVILDQLNLFNHFLFYYSFYNYFWHSMTISDRTPLVLFIFEFESIIVLEYCQQCRF